LLSERPPLLAPFESIFSVAIFDHDDIGNIVPTGELFVRFSNGEACAPVPEPASLVYLAVAR
jgi:hypothetical protein